MSNVPLDQCLELIHNGDLPDLDLAYQVATTTDPETLFEASDNLRKVVRGNYFDLCSIINAKSGRCSEDCRFCAQSSHYDTDIEVYDTISVEDAVALAKNNESHGVKRFSLVTAGKTVSIEKIKEYGKIFKRIGQETSLYLCASMGMLTREKAELLKSFGVQRYHCNLEACRRFFSKVCTSHTWEEKVETINHAKEAGMEVCSGGIIGMGESLEHRLELAIELRELGIMSIPVNVLSPIENTPFEHFQPLSLAEVLTCIAMFRLINPLAVIRLAGGRANMGEEQYRSFQSGGNGAIVGNYLTTKGNELAHDLKKIKDCGFTFEEHDE